jgi:hypothetical protein
MMKNKIKITVNVEVRDIGRNCITTYISHPISHFYPVGNCGYINTPTYPQFLASSPDIVTIMFVSLFVLQHLLEIQ